MEKIEGKDLMVFVGGEAVALSTSCTLSVSADAEEVAWRGDGRWRRYRPGRMGWELTAEGLLPVGDGLLPSVGEEVSVAFYSVPPHPAGEPAGGFMPDGRLGRWGYAIVTEYSEAGETGSYSTRSVKFTGSGELHAGLESGDFNVDFNNDFLV